VRWNKKKKKNGNKIQAGSANRCIQALEKKLFCFNFEEFTDLKRRFFFGKKNVNKQKCCDEI
jgi:hypothetical protein